MWPHVYRCRDGTSSRRDVLSSIQEGAKTHLVDYDRDCCYWFRYARSYWNCHRYLFTFFESVSNLKLKPRRTSGRLTSRF